METAVNAWTEEELMRLPHDGFKCELVEGELRMAPTGFNHEDITVQLTARLHAFVTTNKLGIICGSNLGCWMKSGNLLCPDVSFISRGRVPRSVEDRQRYFHGAPDLVIEVVSPWDRDARLREKMTDYFASGACLAWIIDAREKEALVHTAADRVRPLQLADALDGEDTLPGFRLPLAELFAERSFD